MQPVGLTMRLTALMPASEIGPSDIDVAGVVCVMESSAAHHYVIDECEQKKAIYTLFIFASCLAFLAG